MKNVKKRDEHGLQKVLGKGRYLELQRHTHLFQEKMRTAGNAGSQQLRKHCSKKLNIILFREMEQG